MRSPDPLADRPEIEGTVAMIRRIFPFLYVLVGVVVAAQHHYLHFGTLSRVLSAVLAVALWPLVLLGISLVIH